ncbi:MAG: hypothetical protein QXE43_00505, partial [Candidatus Aenigmatarchaeota archaeon]
MKAISFSLDIILSLTIFSFSLIIFFYFLSIENIGFKNLNNLTIYQELEKKNYANEILLSLISTKVKEINFSIQNLSNYISNDDFEKSLAEIISSLYLSGIYNSNQTLKNIAKEILEEFLKEINNKYCIEIKIGNESI